MSFLLVRRKYFVVLEPKKEKFSIKRPFFIRTITPIYVTSSTLIRNNRYVDFTMIILKLREKELVEGKKEEELFELIFGRIFWHKNRSVLIRKGENIISYRTAVPKNHRMLIKNYQKENVNVGFDLNFFFFFSFCFLGLICGWNRWKMQLC